MVNKDTILMDENKYVKLINREEKFDIIRLSYAKRISCIEVICCLEKCNLDAHKTIEMIREKYKDKVVFPADSEIEEEETKNDRLGIQTITFRDPDYPTCLRHINCFPLILHCRGNLKLLSNKNIIAIIGSRRSPINDVEFTKKIAKELGERKYIIVSGMALGIDASAHFGSLKTGTIAVLGSGIDYIYPKENTQLYNDIINNNGIIISEFGLGTEPFPNNFLQRNRIIAGMSKGVVVVNASYKSGALNTANTATAFGKEVMVFPGNPYDESKIGSNDLIQKGATLVTSTRDIIENVELYIGDEDIFSENNKARCGTKTYKNNILNNDTKKEKAEKNITLDEIMLSKLNHAPLDIDIFINNCKTDGRLRAISSTLTAQVARLELQDKIVIYDKKISLRISKDYCL
ncbi:MAG: DNA-processing protein DprA [Rickettsiales bacterium]|nr:DNA-processing protein DprA [Rickettsiales bacterium]